MATHATARAIVQDITAIHGELLTLSDYKPGPKVNCLLSTLVSLCCEIHDKKIVSQVMRDPAIQALLSSLRRICSQSESDLESYWTDRVMEAGPNPENVHEALKLFPYYDNYEGLAHFELMAILSARSPSSPPIQEVAFLGSGPLPLSSLCLLDMLRDRNGPNKKTRIHNVDMNHAAILRSQALANQLAHKAEGMCFVHGQAGEKGVDLSGMDVINLAALVGETQTQKEAIIINIAKQMKEGAVLVVRSAQGLRVCLYPEFDIHSGSEACTEIKDSGLEPIAEFHPLDRIVNSVVILRRVQR